jgi:hypothetical protein
MSEGYAQKESVLFYHNKPNRINSDWQFRCAPLPTGYEERWRSAPRSANAPRIKDPLVGLRSAPANQRIERMSTGPSALAPRPPLIRGALGTRGGDL